MVAGLPHPLSETGEPKCEHPRSGDRRGKASGAEPVCWLDLGSAVLTRLQEGRGTLEPALTSRNLDNFAGRQFTDVSPRQRLEFIASRMVARRSFDIRDAL